MIVEDVLEECRAFAVEKKLSQVESGMCSRYLEQGYLLLYSGLCECRKVRSTPKPQRLNMQYSNELVDS
nr:hypothetical protein HmN_000750600 [Hymenolepis microstoma]